VEKEKDLILERLKSTGTPVTRENYLDLAYLGNPPKQLDAEQEAALPEELRKESAA
jgi:hypothetical protein